MVKHNISSLALLILGLVLVFMGVNDFLQKDKIVNLPEKFSNAYEKANYKNEFIFLNDEKIYLSELDSEFILINLWASWCAPCVKELPSLHGLQQIYESNKLLVLPILQEDLTNEEIDQFYQKHDIKKFEYYKSPKSRLFINSRMKGEKDSNSLPLTIILDKDKKEIARVRGELDWQDEEIIDFFYDLTN